MDRQYEADIAQVKAHTPPDRDTFPVMQIGDNAYTEKKATVDKGIHDKSTKIELPTLYKVPPKRDYGRYFCSLARKEEPPHRGLMKSQAPFFMPKIRR